MDEQRFWSKVDKSGDCWVWTGYIKIDGYGVYNQIKAHRLSWILINGEIQDNLIVRHKCRNRHCVNPEHLELGTTQDNINDKVRDGTISRGTTISKLTEAQVLEIRNRPESCKDLAKEFNISASQVSKIKNRTSWTWL